MSCSCTPLASDFFWKTPTSCKGAMLCYKLAIAVCHLQAEAGQAIVAQPQGITARALSRYTEYRVSTQHGITQHSKRHSIRYKLQNEALCAQRHYACLHSHLPWR